MAIYCESSPACKVYQKYLSDKGIEDNFGNAKVIVPKEDSPIIMFCEAHRLIDPFTDCAKIHSMNRIEKILFRLIKIENSLDKD